MKRHVQSFLFFALLVLIHAGCSPVNSPDQANESLNQAIEKIGEAASGTVDVSITGELTSLDIARLRAALSNNPWVEVGLDLSGAGLAAVPRNAFYGESTLVKIVLPGTVTVIEESAFERTRLASLSLSHGLNEIKERAFLNTRLSAVEIPEGVASVGAYAFSFEGNGTSAPALSSVRLPSTLTEIGEGAFSRNSELFSISLPKGLTTVGTNAFAYTGLALIEIPASVASIGSSAFNSSRLTRVIVHAAEPPDAPTGTNAVWNAFGYAAPASSFKIQVPQTSVDAYKAAPGWSEYADFIIGSGT